MIDELYAEVTEAILESEDSRSSADQRRAALRRVSELEERIAALLPPSDLEGEAARRGAIRAAAQAGDSGRVDGLLERYLADEALPEPVRSTLIEAARA
jgi:predicted alpha-1,6-mannanase (GH76 family)